MALYEFKAEDAARFASFVHEQVKTKGDELQFRHCPYCHGTGSGNEYTFAINLRSGSFNCKRASCGAKGNMITLSRDFDFSLGAEADTYYKGDHRKYRDLRKYPKPATRDPAVRYMEGRGISKATTEAYNITTQISNDNIIVFPFYDEQDRLQFVKYRKADFDKEKDNNKEWCEKNCRPILFGMNHCDAGKSSVLVLTEGQIDSLSVTEAGIDNAVSVPTGAQGFTWIPYCWDFLGKFKTLIVFGDYEKDHITLLDVMSRKFHGTVKHVRPEDYRGCKDANEILQKYGRQAVRDAVENAEPVKNPKIIRMADIEKVNPADREHFNTGIAQLNRILGGFYMGQLILITGRRGEGKSTLGSQFGTQAIKGGYNVFYYSGELANEMVQDWFDRQMAGDRYIITEQKQYGYENYFVKLGAVPAMHGWYYNKVFLYDNTITLDENGEEDTQTLLNVMESAVKQYDCKVLIVDNLMTAMEDDISSDLYRQQTAFVRKLAWMAKSMDVVIFLIAHPRKNNDSEIKNDDVSGSSNITNLCDVVMSYSAPDPKKPPEDRADRLLSVTKNRLNGELTKNPIHLFYQKSSKRISSDRGCFDWEIGWEKEFGGQDPQQQDDDFVQIEVDEINSIFGIDDLED